MSTHNIRDRIKDVRSRFDERQNRAVDAIIDRWDSGGDDAFIFPIVDGPPGTGKTSVGVTAYAEYILEHPDEQIIYLCYTHFAADVAREAFFRYGFTSDEVVRLTPNIGEVDWSKGIFGCSSDLSEVSHNVVRRLQNCAVLICTLHGSKRAFKVRDIAAGRRITRVIRVIVDEFSQVAPPLWFSCLQQAKYANLRPTAYALLGDPYQLPIVTTQPELQENIGEFIQRISGCDVHELRIQHRMHKDICEAVNQLRDALNCPYRLESGDEVKNRDLTHPDLGFEWNEYRCSSEFREILDPQNPLVIVDTSRLSEEERCFGGSLRNNDEAKYATRIAMAFYNSYRRNSRELTSSDLKILSPYSGQVGLIQQLLNREGLSGEFCTTIYRSQGREYPCVIISFVRNNPGNFIGFLGEPKLRAQAYVGCSRAQGKLVILLSHKCFGGRGYRDFDYLCRTKTAHHVEVRT